MAESLTARPYPTEPTEPTDPPIEPTFCPTCRSGMPTPEPTYEEAVLAEY